MPGLLQNKELEGAGHRLAGDAAPKGTRSFCRRRFANAENRGLEIYPAAHARR